MLMNAERILYCAQMCPPARFTKPHTFQLIKCSALIKFNYGRCGSESVSFTMVECVVLIWLTKNTLVRNNISVDLHLSQTAQIPPFLHGCIHALHKPALSLWLFCPAARRSFTSGSEGLKLNSDSYWLSSFPPCNPPADCGPIPCERQMWSSSQTVPTRSLTPSVSKHVCLVSRCIAV